MKMQGDSIISALIGLVGAVSNNGKTEQTDSVIREAFLCLTDAGSEEEMVQKIHAEKFIIAPDCATCLNPCGSTTFQENLTVSAASTPEGAVLFCWFMKNIPII